MVIQNLTLYDFGDIKFHTFSFDFQLNLIDSRISEALSVAIEILLLSRSPRDIPGHMISKRTRLFADIEAGGEVFQVHAAYGDAFRVIAQIDGVDVTKRYRSAVRHCQEQDVTECFGHRDFSTRLYKYREQDPWDALSLRTDRSADTQIFRTQLRQFIRSFQPEPINNQKQYMLNLGREGNFYVTHPLCSEPVHLSTTEQKLYQYHCFLNIAEFWERFERLRDLHHEKKPLIVQSFLEYLDESTDISGLLTRTLQLNRQIFILTIPMEEETKTQWLSQYAHIKQKGA